MTLPLRFIYLPCLLAVLSCTTKGSGPKLPQDPGTGLAEPADSSAVRHLSAPPPEWQVLADDSSLIVLGDTDTVRTGATGLVLLLRIADPMGKPWFLFSGKDTAGSARNDRSLFALSPGMKPGEGPQRSWHMPGRLLDTGGKAYYEADVFAGQVLPDTIGVIWYDRSLMPDGQWRLNTTLLNLDRPTPDTLVLFGQRRRSATIDLAVKGKCRMLQPMDQVAADR